MKSSSILVCVSNRPHPRERSVNTRKPCGDTWQRRPNRLFEYRTAPARHEPGLCLFCPSPNSSSRSLAAMVVTEAFLRPRLPAAARFVLGPWRPSHPAWISGRGACGPLAAWCGPSESCRESGLDTTVLKRCGHCGLDFGRRRGVFSGPTCSPCGGRLGDDPHAAMECGLRSARRRRLLRRHDWSRGGSARSMMARHFPGGAERLATRSPRERS